MKRLSAACLGLVLFACLASCERITSMGKVLVGNMNYDQGEYQDSIVAYMDVGPGHEDLVGYNLGNVYASLGETEAALRIWNQALSSSDRNLQFHILYNRGGLQYELGRFEEAAKSFKAAIELDSTNMDAKVNYELALRKTVTSSAKSTAPSDIPDEASKILNYVQSKEENRWQASREIQETNQDRDW